jgi:hypothetical protein
MLASVVLPTPDMPNNVIALLGISRNSLRFIFIAVSAAVEGRHYTVVGWHCSLAPTAILRMLRP